MNTQELRDRGRVYYNRGQLANAISQYDLALRIQPSVQLLDERAACFASLGDFKSAMQDARATIALSKTDGTGYLRGSRTFVALGHLGRALGLIKYGLDNVGHDGRKYQSLLTLKAELEDELAPKFDPLTKLPPELVHVTLDFLDFRERIKVSSLSRGWREFVRESPRLWDDVDLSDTRCRIPTAFMLRALKCSKHNITKATLVSRLDKLPDMVDRLIADCPCLQELNLKRYDLVDGRLLSCIAASDLRAVRLDHNCQFSTQDLDYLMEMWPTGLTTLIIARMTRGVLRTPRRVLTQLRQLELCGQIAWTRLYDAFLPKLSLLTSLVIREENAGYAAVNAGLVIDTTAFPHLEILQLQVDCTGINEIKLQPSIRSLHLFLEDRLFTRRLSRGQKIDFLLPSFQMYLPQLEELGVSVDAFMTLDEVETFLNFDLHAPEAMSSLSRLALRMHRAVETDAARVVRLLGNARLKELKELQLLGFRKGVDDILAELPVAAASVECLDVSDTDVTGVGLYSLRQCRLLKQLAVHDCNKLARDAVDMMRGQGVETDCRNFKRILR